MKVIVTGLQLIFSKWIVAWGNFSMKMQFLPDIRYANNQSFKVVSVMFIVPVILNVLQVNTFDQFLIQDQFIKKHDFEITDVEIMRDFYDCTGSRRVSDLYFNIDEPLNESNNYQNL